MTTKIEHKGKWRLPQTDEWFDGTLSFDPDIGARLEIFGTFNTFFLDRSSKEIILGKTTAGDITLIDNWYRNTKTIHNGITIGTYEPIFILIGQHFETTEEISFRKVIFRAFNLFQWLDKAGLKFDSDYSAGSYNVSFKRPDSIYFNLTEACSGEISFESPTNSSDFYNKIELSEQAYVVLSYTEKTPYKTILKDIRVFIGFITLNTFEQSYALNITFRDKDYTEEIQNFKSEKNIKCFFQNNSYDSKYKLRRKHEHLVKYEDIQEKFPTLIQHWYKLYLQIEPVFTLMLYKFRNKLKFSIDLFMDNVRAIESYHRFTHNNSRIPDEEYNHKVDKILDSVDLDSKDIEWLSQKLKYGNEPSLNMRLKELIKENQNSYIKEKLSTYKKFCQAVVDNRNFYTHYDKDLEKKALKGRELFDINLKVEGILYSCIFKELGFDNNEFEKGLKYHLEK